MHDNFCMLDCCVLSQNYQYSIKYSVYQKCSNLV